jgi:hypothetical protein
MKKLVSLIGTVLMMAGLAAQAPATMSYQAVIRNVSGVLITNTQIGIEINIRQGSPTGTIVYTETQTPTTNDNGLVSLEIGGGDGFSAINWAADTYFIETNTAVTPPLTTYTITGVSKLMSVPYALYAKSAETITGTLPETDPMYSSSKAASITEADLTNLSNLSGINTGDQDLSGLATIPALTTGLAAKVDKVDGKGLSSNDYTSEEKTKLEGIAAGAQVNVKADWNAESGDAMILNKPTIPAAADGSETVVTAGSNVSITGTGTTESPYVINATSSTSTPLAIGQNYQGGIIFWLDATGQHGLIAATADQGTNIAWHNGVDKSTGTRGDGLYAGEMNTVISIVMQKNDNPEGSFAAQVCADYSVTADGVVYGDWYLPSFYELKLLHAQKDIVGGFNTGNYWSSTERDTQLAMYQNFNPAGGHASGALKNYASFSARAIRSF